MALGKQAAESHLRVPPALRLRGVALLHALVWLLAILHMLPYLTGAPYGDDVRVFFWPAWTFTRQAVASGHFPLWNPYVGCGESWFSNFQAGLFYPLNLLFYLAPYEKVLTLYFILMMGLNGSAALFMLDSAGFAPLPALAGAVTWQWSGYYMMYQPCLAYAATLSWVAALTGCLLRAQQSERPTRWVVAGAACFACLWLTGSPHFAYIGTLLQLFWVDWKRPWRALLIPVVGSLLAAIQLVPSATFLANSPRSAMSPDFNLSFSLGLDHLPALVIAEVYRLYRSIPPVAFECYFGVVPTLIACHALTSRQAWPSTTTRRAVLLVVVGILMAVGGATPFFPVLLKVVPGMALFRAPGRFIMFSILGLSVLVAEGVRRCEARWHWPLVGLILFDLGWLSAPYLASGVFVVPPPLQALAQDPYPYRIQLADADFKDVDIGQIIGHGNVTVYDPMTPRSYVEYQLFNELQSIPETSLYEQANYNSNAIYLSRLDTPSYRLLNIQYRFRQGRLEPTNGSLPHFFMAGRQQVIPKLDDTLMAMRTFDPQTLVLVDREAPAIEPSETPQVQLRHFDCNDWTVQVQVQHPGLLVASELYYPGWRAAVDGQEAPIYRADGIFRAVYVPAGTHEVSMHYDPPAWRYGLMLTGLSLLGCLAALWRR